MKKLLLPFLALLLLMSCEEESFHETDLQKDIAEISREGGASNARRSGKIDVCHKGDIINVSVNAIKAHQGHGDAIDMDGDGYFDIDNSCSATDCDDSDASVNPDATEVPYDGIDNDCDPATLDDDLDEDGFTIDEDCDDTDADVNPDAAEVPYDGIDNDCDPATLDDDLDQDGFNIDEDCDDTDAAVNPDAEEVPYDGVDNDCDAATLDDDLDQDGYNLDEDCDDTNPDLNVDCGDPCLDEAINQVTAEILGLGGSDLSTTITGPNTFFILWNSGGRNGRGCIKTTAEATGDPGTGCGFTNRFHNNVPCSS